MAHLAILKGMCHIFGIRPGEHRLTCPFFVLPSGYVT